MLKFAAHVCRDVLYL